MGIDRRSFLTASASVILTVTTIGGKQFAQAAGARSPERPWQEAFEEKSADPRIGAMAFAILAPNVFNLQPWLAELPGDDRLLLHCDPARRLPQCDREDRETVISFGNFLELLSPLRANS